MTSQVSDVFLASLERLVILLVEHYPRLSKKMHFVSFVSIAKVLYALFPKTSVFNKFLAQIG